MHTPEGQHCDARHVGMAVLRFAHNVDAAHVARLDGKNLARTGGGVAG